jgi:eukaryotic-like serine/threonine-protein kinase
MGKWAMPDATPSQFAPDRNLLFGILALQLDFIDREALIAAMNAWVLDKTKPLGQILYEQGRLSAERRQLLEGVVREHVRAHGQDLRQSLASLSSVAPIRQALAEIDDAEVQASLALAGATASADRDATTQPGTSRAAEGSPAVVRYRILRPYARGGLGEVYVAEDTELHRHVALKEIQARYADDPVGRSRFLLEAEVTGGLEHPGIVPVYGLGQYADGRPFYAMRFIKGDNLKEAIGRFHGTAPSAAIRQTGGLGGEGDSQRNLAFRQLLRRFVDVCNAVAYAHSRGVLHRDLKPGNIMLGKYGETLLVDWGLAKPLGSSEPDKSNETGIFLPSSGSCAALTEMGAIVGTPAFMSPEQASGKWDELGVASDVYGLGATLYALLTGQPPVSDVDPLAVLDKVQNGRFPRPRDVKPSVPPALEAVCQKAMALAPPDRYESARQLADDIEHWLADEPVRAYRDPLSTSLRRWARRHKAFVAAAAALVLTSLVALGSGIVIVEQERKLTAQQRDEKQRALIALGQEQGQTQAALVLAQERTKLAEHRLAENYLDRGLILCEQGDIGSGMLWLARSLETVQADDVALERTIRGNLANWYPSLSPLRQLLGKQSSDDFGGIWAVALSPDGKTALTASFDGTAHLWDAATGKPLGVSLQHQERVQAAVFSPDGKTILTGSFDCTAQLWEAATGKSLGALLEHQCPVVAVAFSPNGKIVLTGSWDGTAKLWDAATGKLIGRPMQHQQEVQAVAFSPDGKAVCTGSRDKTAQLWEVATGKPLGSPMQHDGRVQAVAFSPDGKTVLTGSADKLASLWEAATGKLLETPLQHQEGAQAMAFSPDGKTVLTGTADKSAQLWELATGKPLGPPMQHQGGVVAVAFSPDSKTLLTGSIDGNARIWSATAGTPVGSTFLHRGQVLAVAFSPDGKTILTGSVDGTARLWKAATGEPQGSPLQHHGEVQAVAFAPDGRSVLTGSVDGTARLWEATTGKPLGVPLQCQGPVHAVSFSPDAKTFVSGSFGANQWDATSGKPVGQPIQHDGAVVQSVAYSPDGKTLLTGSLDGTARLWEAATGKRLGEALHHQGAVFAVAYSPDSKTLLTGSFDGTARLWEAATGKRLGEPLHHQGPVLTVSFSPDGKTVGTGGRDNLARLWDAVTGKPLAPPFQHRDEVVGIAFSPDGKTLLTGSSDASARLWDVATGKPLGPSLQHRGAVRAIAFSPEGKVFLTGSEDKTARLWPVLLAIDGRPRRITLWLSILTGMELDRTGALVVLGADEWRQRRGQLVELGGPIQP